MFKVNVPYSTAITAIKQIKGTNICKVLAYEITHVKNGCGESSAIT